MRISVIVVGCVALSGCGKVNEAPASSTKSDETRAGASRVSDGAIPANDSSDDLAGSAKGKPRLRVVRPTTPSSACLRQDGHSLPAVALSGVGTEPFWGVRVEGRCVTYSHPEDQAGVRIWTRFSGTADDGRWTGTYRGMAFILRTQQQADCSDGMSDRRYPVALSLTVGGEKRQGCAAPL